jgi:hypothetical protein
MYAFEFTRMVRSRKRQNQRRIRAGREPSPSKYPLVIVFRDDDVKLVANDDGLLEAFWQKFTDHMHPDFGYYSFNAGSKTNTVAKEIYKTRNMEAAYGFVTTRGEHEYEEYETFSPTMLGKRKGGPGYWDKVDSDK